MIFLTFRLKAFIMKSNEEKINIAEEDMKRNLSLFLVLVLTVLIALTSVACERGADAEEDVQNGQITGGAGTEPDDPSDEGTEGGAGTEPDEPSDEGAEGGAGGDSSEDEPHICAFVWSVELPATCESDGRETGVCSCGKTEEKILTATGHTYNKNTSYDENSHYAECSCGAPSGAVAHTFGGWETLVPISCGQNGSDRRECACGYEEIKDIINTGHVVSEVKYSATIHWSLCTCGVGFDYIAHTSESMSTVREATCEVTGLESGLCTFCGVEFQKETAKLPHTYDKKLTTEECLRTPATYNTRATYYYSCACGLNTRYLNDSSIERIFEYGELVEAPKPARGSYVRTDAAGNFDADGDHIFFGYYPQSEIDDAALANTLTLKAGELPVIGDNAAWTSYGYYIKDSAVGEGLWYIDIEHDGEKYRGVYFVKYRPIYTTNPLDDYNTYQDDHGYTSGNVYWFRYEPIQWRILTVSEGRALLLCDMIIDSLEFYSDNDDRSIGGETVYANNYEHSNIRKWLSDNFYNTVFTDLEKELVALTRVDNSVSTTPSEYTSPCVCPDTDDYVFLLSYKDILNTEYGFSEYGFHLDPNRQKTGTDYAKCQGLGIASFGTDYVGSSWWLRSPMSQYGYIAGHVTEEGKPTDGDIYASLVGVCPAIWIIL